MHNLILERLQSFEDEAKSSGNTGLYLERLGPLHAAWHRVSPDRRRIGFLLFHWHVVDHFKNLGLDNDMGVTSYIVNDFSQGGQFAEADWNSYMGNVGPSQSLDDLISYSVAIESWHNDAHMAIGDVTGAPMMDPRINIFYTPFWNLHFFINQKFETELQSYSKISNLGINSSSDIVNNIESLNHLILGRI